MDLVEISTAEAVRLTRDIFLAISMVSYSAHCSDPSFVPPFAEGLLRLVLQHWN
jgi:hypothetical protein